MGKHVFSSKEIEYMLVNGLSDDFILYLQNAPKYIVDMVSKKAQDIGQSSLLELCFSNFLNSPPNTDLEQEHDTHDTLCESEEFEHIETITDNSVENMNNSSKGNFVQLSMFDYIGGELQEESEATEPVVRGEDTVGNLEQAENMIIEVIDDDSEYSFAEEVLQEKLSETYIEPKFEDRMKLDVVKLYEIPTEQSRCPIHYSTMTKIQVQCKTSDLDRHGNPKYYNKQILACSTCERLYMNWIDYKDFKEIMLDKGILFEWHDEGEN